MNQGSLEAISERVYERMGEIEAKKKTPHISGNSHLSDPDSEKGRQAEESCRRR